MLPDEIQAAARERAHQLVDSMPVSGLTEMVNDLECLVAYYEERDALPWAKPPRTRIVTGTVVGTLPPPVLVIEEE